MNVVSQIDADPAFQRSLTGWKSCMNQAGVKVSTVNEFFGLLDRRAQTEGGPNANIGLAKTYAVCLARPEAIRDGLRRHARSTFVTEHSTAIKQLLSDINAKLT